MKSGEALALAAAMGQGSKAAIAQARSLEDANKALSAWLQGLTQVQLQQALATASAGKLREAQQGVAGMFDRSKTAIVGWAAAGLVGTTMGERLNFQTAMLRREITQLFLPAIEQVSEWLRKLTNVFRGLSGEQQANIGKWLLSGVAVLGTLVLLPRVLAAVDNIKKGWTALSLVMTANPFFAAAAGIAVLMAGTKEGRKGLEEIGNTLLDVFGSVAETVGGVLLPMLEGVADFLSSGAGKVIVFAAVFTIAFRLMAAAVAPLIMAIYGLFGAIGLVTAAIALLFLGFGKSKLDKTLEEIAKAVRAGKMTVAEAREAVAAEADKAGLQAEEKERTGARSALARFAGMPEEGKRGEIEAGARAQAEALEKGNALVDRAAERAKKRSELMLAQTSQEDPRATINRIQSAALKAQDPVAKNTEEIAGDVKAILARIMQVMNVEAKDNRDRPPKDD